jgi:hypothetical protein
MLTGTVNHNFVLENRMITLTSQRLSMILRVLGLAVLMAGLSFAQAPTININFDENCNGTFQNISTGGALVPLPCGLFADPGPGGLPSVLFYNMLNPPGMVLGDVIIKENSDLTSDILRFDPVFQGGGIFVYSDVEALDPQPALADIGLISAFNTNVLTFLEVGPEGNNGLAYTPTAGQPGFVPGFNVTYTFSSDTPIPEPATAGLMVLGGGLILVARLRRRSRKRSE